MDGEECECIDINNKCVRMEKRCIRVRTREVLAGKSKSVGDEL